MPTISCEACRENLLEAALVTATKGGDVKVSTWVHGQEASSVAPAVVQRACCPGLPLLHFIAVVLLMRSTAHVAGSSDGCLRASAHDGAKALMTRYFRTSYHYV